MRGKQEQDSRDAAGGEQQAHGFEASVSSVISFGRWSLKFLQDALRTAKKEKPQRGSCQKTAAFSPESFKCTRELQQLLQGEVPSQAAKWVTQAKSLWSTSIQHSP